jgi:hypothetical protein
MGKGLFVCFFFVFSQISLGSREKFRKHEEEEEEIRSSMQKKTNDEDSLVLIFSPKAATVAA